MYVDKFIYYYKNLSVLSVKEGRKEGRKEGMKEGVLTEVLIIKERKEKENKTKCKRIIKV